MHEMTLAEEIILLLEQQAVTQGFTCVKQLWLEIGDLAGVDAEALGFCLETIKRDTLAADARVHIRHQPGQGHCPRCEQTLIVHSRLDACPQCGHYPLQIQGGDAMRVCELEVE